MSALHAPHNSCDNQTQIILEIGKRFDVDPTHKPLVKLTTDLGTDFHLSSSWICTGPFASQIRTPTCTILFASHLCTCPPRSSCGRARGHAVKIRSIRARKSTTWHGDLRAMARSENGETNHVGIGIFVAQRPICHSAQ